MSEKVEKEPQVDFSWETRCELRESIEKYSTECIVQLAQYLLVENGDPGEFTRMLVNEFCKRNDRTPEQIERLMMCFTNERNEVGIEVSVTCSGVINIEPTLYALMTDDKSPFKLDASNMPSPKSVFWNLLDGLFMAIVKHDSYKELNKDIKDWTTEWAKKILADGSRQYDLVYVVEALECLVAAGGIGVESEDVLRIITMWGGNYNDEEEYDEYDIPGQINRLASMVLQNRIDKQQGTAR